MKVSIVFLAIILSKISFGAYLSTDLVEARNKLIQERHVELFEELSIYASNSGIEIISTGKTEMIKYEGSATVDSADETFYFKTPLTLKTDNQVTEVEFKTVLRPIVQTLSYQEISKAVVGKLGEIIKPEKTTYVTESRIVIASNASLVNKTTQIEFINDVRVAAYNAVHENIKSNSSLLESDSDERAYNYNLAASAALQKAEKDNERLRVIDSHFSKFYVVKKVVR